MSRLPIAALPLCLLLLAGTVPAALGVDARPATPQRKVALGMATWDGRNLGQLDWLSSAIGGRRPAIWVIWSQWGSDRTRGFPWQAARGLAARGVTPMIWWEPATPGKPRSARYARFANIAGGQHDEYIRRFARDARAFGRPILLRFAHEANGTYFPWSIGRFGNTPRTYKSAWRHVHRIFRRERATNVRFVWSVAKKRCPGGCNPFTRLYPGDRYVDQLGVSVHNWGRMRRWVPMYRGARGVTRQLREVSRKPIIVAESGSNPLGGDKARWIWNGYRKIYRKLPAIKAIVYLNADLRGLGHPDWRITSPRSALTAYARIAAMDQFSAGWRAAAR